MLKITEPVPVEVVKLPVCKYVIYLEFMHGDADEYGEDTITYSSASSAEEAYKMFTEVSKLDHHSRNYETFEDMFGEETAEFLCDIIPHDVTANYNYLAGVTVRGITYFNSSSVEYHVEVI